MLPPRSEIATSSFQATSTRRPGHATDSPAGAIVSLVTTGKQACSYDCHFRGQAIFVALVLISWLCYRGSQPDRPWQLKRSSPFMHRKTLVLAGFGAACAVLIASLLGVAAGSASGQVKAGQAPKTAKVTVVNVQIGKPSE